MKSGKLFSRSVALWKRHLPGLMLSRFISILCHMMAAAPLLLLLYPPTEWLAVCSIPLYLLIIPALKHNHAEMLMDVQAADVYLPLHLVSGEKYGKKLLGGLRDGAWRFVALAPLFGCIGYALTLYAGDTDSFTVLRELSAVTEGDWLDGLMNRIGILLAAVLPYFFMRALLSWRVYGRAVHAGRKFIRGYRLRLCGVWLLSLLAYVPFMVIAGSALTDYAASCGESVIRLLMNGGKLPPMTGLFTAWVIGIVLTQPLCMLRQVLLSTFVHDITVAKEDAADDAA